MTFHSFLLIDVFLYIVVIPCIVYFLGVLFYEAVANDKFKIASTKTNKDVSNLKSSIYVLGVFAFKAVFVALSIPLFIEFNSNFFILYLSDIPLFLLKVIGFYLITDTLFYWGHRLLHLKFFYKNFHYLHHKYINPKPVSGAFVHVVEYFVCYSFPYFLGNIILDLTLLEFCIVISMGYLHNVHDHCGHKFPWDIFNFIKYSNNVSHHDVHHKNPKCNFSGGFFKFWDAICGTRLK